MAAWNAFLRGLERGIAARGRPQVDALRVNIKASKARGLRPVRPIVRGPNPAQKMTESERRDKRLANLPNVLPQIIAKVNRAGFMEKIIDERFENEGNNWKQLAPSTVKRRGSAHPILQVTGRLKKGAIRGVAGTFRGEKPPNWRSRTKFTRVPYAKYHQQGTSNMPARTFYRNPGKKEMSKAMRFYHELIDSYIKTGKF